MASTLLRAAAAAAARSAVRRAIPSPGTRAYLHAGRDLGLDPRRHLPDHTALMKLDAVERAKVMKILEQLNAEAQTEIAQAVDNLKGVHHGSGDHVFLNRLFNCCGVPEGEFREKLFWRCNLAAMFLTAGALGMAAANKSAQLKHDEKLKTETNNVAQ